MATSARSCVQKAADDAAEKQRLLLAAAEALDAALALPGVGEAASAEQAAAPGVRLPSSRERAEAFAAAALVRHRLGREDEAQEVRDCFVGFHDFDACVGLYFGDVVRLYGWLRSEE